MSVDADNIISQEALHRAEAKCTAEEPAACMAACPLHVDARALCMLIGKGDFAGAFRAYQKTVPFARILAHTCQAPCKGYCVRKDYGGAIHMERLERVMARQAGQPEKPPVLLRKKDQRAAVIGGGIRGMTAAHDLAKKGYQVTLFEKTGVIGGSLRALSETVLPRAVLDEECRILFELGVSVVYHTEIPIDTKDSPVLLPGDYDGVYISCASRFDGRTDEETQQLPGHDRILAGRKRDALRAGAVHSGEDVVYAMYDGRSAALTLIRLFQGVNLLEGRTREGGYQTTLFTDTDEVVYEKSEMEDIQEPSGRLKQEKGQDGLHSGKEAEADAAVREAARCIWCRCEMCVRKCAFLRHYGKNPRRYVREVYNNLSIAMGTHHANQMIDSCALCGQCAVVCPNGLDMGELFLAARTRMVRTKKMPPSAFSFGMRDLDYSLSDAFFLARHQAAHEASEVLFFPGCQLSASEPALVMKTYEWLCTRFTGGVGLMLSCCGILAHWAGEELWFLRAKEKITTAWEALGKPRIIAACPSCASLFADEYKIPAVSLFTEMAGMEDVAGHPDICTHANTDTGDRHVYHLHHACGARHSDGIKESVRRLADRCGITVTEGANDEESPCCGFGGLVSVSNREVSDALTACGLSQIGGGSDEEPILTYCASCRDRFLAAGKQAVHLLELFFSDADGIRHMPPTASMRQDNRAALKDEMLTRFWRETRERTQGLTLYIDETLEQKLEERHILHSDIADVISHAETYNQKLFDPDTGHFIASHRPGYVTFWVEYTVESIQDILPPAYRIHSAYSHRMAFTLSDTRTNKKGE